jgi:hypothetical protein
MNIEIKKNSKQILIDSFSLYNYLDMNHYARWVTGRVQKLGREGDDIFLKPNSNKYLHNYRRYRYWIDIKLAIYLLRIMDTKASIRLSNILDRYKSLSKL